MQQKEKTLTAIRLPAALRAQLDALAHERRESLTSLITTLLSSALGAQAEADLAPWAARIARKVEKRLARLIAKAAMEASAARALVLNLYPAADRERIWNEVRQWSWREARWGGEGSASESPVLSEAAGGEK